ncbi:MAG: hypothetical protein LUI02_00450 [Clostridiales bacterium]|nr:hypothetical protein [Clostridiales bacterium]
MKKNVVSKVLAGCMALALAVTGVAVAPTTAKAAESFTVTIGCGGDIDHSASDWGATATITEGTVTMGGSVTVKAEFDTPASYIWYIAPAIVFDDTGYSASDVTDLDYSIDSILVNGEDVTYKLDSSQGKLATDGEYDVENTDPYSDTIRLDGSYNEWGPQSLPINTISDSISSVEYTITVNSITFEDGTVLSADSDSSSSSDDSAAADDTTTDSSSSSTGTADMVPVAGVVVALLGCAVVAFAVRKKVSR